MDRISKPICTDAEKIKSYEILLSTLQSEKNNNERTNAIVVNTYISKLKETEKRLSYFIGKNHRNNEMNCDNLRHSSIISPSLIYSSMSLQNDHKIDPNQKTVYEKKIDDLLEKNKLLKLENKGLKEMVNQYSNGITEEQYIKIQQAHIKEIEQLKEDTSSQINKIIDEKGKEINTLKNNWSTFQDKYDPLLIQCDIDKKEIEVLNKKLKTIEEKKNEEIELLTKKYADLQGKYDILNILNKTK